jgi:predicted ester cyclase
MAAFAPDRPGGMSRRGLVAAIAATLTACAGAPKHQWAGRRSRLQPRATNTAMSEIRMFELAQALAVAKSRQDVPAALELLHPDMVLENPAFGTKARGLGENERALTRFFAMFPDYSVALEGHASNEDTLVCWGTVRMTMTGDRFGAIPNGRRAELPVFIQFNFKDELIARELFFFDLSELCAQSGISTDAVRARLFGERGQSTAAADQEQGGAHNE